MPCSLDVFDCLGEEDIGLLEWLKQLFEVNSWFSEFLQQNVLDLCKSCSLHASLQTQNNSQSNS